jgi:aminoglycoside phosphotransferase (APT) family kinase protein
MNATLAAALMPVLARLIPGFRSLQACERLSGGASQETWRLVVETEAGAQRCVLRRAPGGVAASLAHATLGLDAEAQLLAAAADAGVPVPGLIGRLVADDGLGPGFVMAWLDGETVGTQILRSDALAGIRPQLAQQCGEVLARIHAIDPDVSGGRALLPERTPEQLVRETWSMYQEYGTPQPMIDYAARWLLDHLPVPRKPCLVHGDFRNGNLMIAPGRGIVGVLDWELAHLGNPMRDLGWLCTPSWRFGRHDKLVGGFGDVADLLDGYASVAGRRPDEGELHWWMVFGAFWWSVGTLTMTDLYRQGPDRSVERLAIGRRSSECQVDLVNLLIPGPVAPPPAPLANDVDMPRTDELLDSVIAYLRDEVAAEAKGRGAFMAKVAAHSLGIVTRELRLGNAIRARERSGLCALLGRDGDVAALRAELVDALRTGSLPLDRPGLDDWLRQTVTDRIGVDQPRYAGLAS